MANTVWEHINILKGGKNAHHKSTTNMAMRMADGKIATNTKENIGVFDPHFSKLLNSERAIDKSVLDLIQQCRKLRSINKRITFMGVNKAINRLKRGKAPGLNGVPLEALKAMNPTMRREIHGCVGKADYKSWHKSRCVTVPNLACNVGFCVCRLHPPNNSHLCLLLTCQQCWPNRSATFC